MSEKIYKSEKVAKSAATQKDNSHYRRRGFFGGWRAKMTGAGWVVNQDEGAAVSAFRRRGEW